MGHQVQEFEERKCCSENVEQVVACPRGWSVIRVQEEVHVQTTENEPVVETVLEYIEEGHGVKGESMDKEGFQFSLQVVTNDHTYSKFLVQSVGFSFPIDLLLEEG